MKTQLGILNVLILLLAGSFAASAQQSFSVRRDVLLLLTRNSDIRIEIIRKVELPESGTQLNAEEEPEVRDWMLHSSEWPDNDRVAAMTESVAVEKDTVEKEADPDTEEWMILRDSWGPVE